MFGFSSAELVHVRDAGFGSQFNSGNSNNALGVANGDWLRYSITLGEEVAGSRDYSVGIRNLTDSVDLDLNGATAGNLYTNSLTAAQVGTAPESSRGGFVRVSGAGSSGGFLDNLTYTVVPEPSSFALLALGLGALFATRRRWA